MKREAYTDRIRRELREEIERRKAAVLGEWKTWEDFLEAVKSSENCEQLKMDITEKLYEIDG